MFYTFYVCIIVNPQRSRGDRAILGTFRFLTTLQTEILTYTGTFDNHFPVVVCKY